MGISKEDAKKRLNSLRGRCRSQFDIKGSVASVSHSLHTAHLLYIHSFNKPSDLFQDTSSFYPNNHHHSTMKFLAIPLLTTLVAASPIVVTPAANELGARQLDGGMTRNELQDGKSPCPKAIFIFARGSTETGNMVCSRTETIH